MGKSPLVAVAVGFSAGLVLGEIFTFYPLLLSILFLTLLLIERLSKGRIVVPLSLFIPCAAGFIAYPLISTPFSPEDLRWHVDRGPLQVVAQVSGPPRHSPERVVFPMEAISLKREGAPLPIRGFFQLTVYSPETFFEYGDRLEFEIRLRRPQQFQNPGSFQYADYREREGWSGVASLTSGNPILKVGEGGSPFFKSIYRWREKIRRQMIGSLEGVPAALLMALIIGEPGYLTDAIRERFSASGTTHILSISGSHLALVSFLSFTLIRSFLLRLPSPLLLRISIWKIPSQWAALLTAAPVTFYAFLAGGETATLRSLTMILVYLFSVWSGRGHDLDSSLSSAALLILIFQPLAVFDIAFQLSFLSILTIVLFTRWGRRPVSPDATEAVSFHREYLFRPLSVLLFSTLGATVGLAPLSLYYFHQFSWAGLFSNLLIVPLAGWILVPFGLASAILSLILETGFPFSSWHHALATFYYQLTTFFSEFPGAELHFPSPSLLGVVLFYLVVFSLLVRSVSWKWILPVILAFFSVFLGFGAIRFAPEALRVSFLDVGQGDAILIEFPGGKTMLVDAGAGGPFDTGKVAVAPYLWERKIRTIDYLVGTHPQMDHMGGLTYILRKFDVKEVWTDGLTSDKPFYQSFSETLRQKGLRPRPVHQGAPPIEIDRCRLLFLNPPEKPLSSEKDFNNRSIVFHLSCPSLGKEGISFLFTGDIGAEAEERLLENTGLLRSTILKVPHHGSKHSSGRAFVAAVSPRIVLVSVGKHNPYHHPSQEIINFYNNFGSKTYRTDRDGALIITAPEGDASEPIVQTYREGVVEKIKWGRAPLSQEWNNIKKLLFPSNHIR